MASETSQPSDPPAQGERITRELFAHVPKACSVNRIREAISTSTYLARLPKPADRVVTLLAGLVRASDDGNTWAAQERREGSSDPWRAVRLNRLEIITPRDARDLLTWRRSRKPE